jgi:enoyl-CoA hydratase
MALLASDVSGGVALITLNDPARRNAISAELSAALICEMDVLESRNDVSAVVITGAPPAFCAGARVEDLMAVRDGDHQLLQTIYDAFLRVAHSTLPTVAAVNGPAVGAGLNLALACDVRVAGYAARFDTRFMKLGLHPGGGHTWMLSRAVGWQTSSAMLLLGAVIDALGAERCGLVWQTVPDDELLPFARQLAGGVLAADRDVLLATKNGLRRAAASADLNEVVDHEKQAQLHSMQGDAFAARLRSARQKPSR